MCNEAVGNMLTGQSNWRIQGSVGCGLLMVMEYEATLYLFHFISSSSAFAWSNCRDGGRTELLH